MGTTAILLVHGILGRPEQFSALMPLIPQDWIVRNITLKGHGGTPQEFGKYPMSDWKAEVHREAAELCDKYDTVLIVGHSLGTLFAMEESLCLPIEGLFLTNVPLGVRVTPKLFKMSIQVFLERIDQKDEFVVAAKNAYGILPDRNILHYIKWIPRFCELFGRISHARKIIDSVKVNSTAVISSKDEMAAPRKSAKIINQRTEMKLIILPDSGHFYYAGADRKVLQEAFGEFVSKYCLNADK